MHATQGDSVALFDIPVRADIRHVAIGMFDGVHAGHRAVVGELINAATVPAASDISASPSAPPPAVSHHEGMAVMTFEPHPLSVIAPDRAPPRLTTPGQRRKLLLQAGASEVISVSFTPHTRDLSSSDFISELERIFPRLRTIVVGPGWTFGRDRAGNALTLNQRGATAGYRVMEVAPVMAGGLPLSSTRIREAIGNGNLLLAKEFLGRSHTLSGTVTHGRQNGRRIGFPTANLGGVFQMLPPFGVYATRAVIHGHGGHTVSIPSMTNIGIRPTIDDSATVSVEAHLLDFHQDIYGRELELSLESFIRPERRFSGLDELKSQIKTDEVEARRILTFI
ncbi:MAG: riboflavin biosynthesis protein RibF [Candidatus Methylacidiphilales bacterium]|nr:riboflavin biosynthesis protein RibF [Candidatus Methylacidiphilales bacterium]